MKFTIGDDTSYDGVYCTTKEDRWNGWATPRFEFGTACQILADLKISFTSIPRASDGKPFLYWLDQDGNADSCAPDGDNLYGVGAYSWVWYEVLRDCDVCDGRGCSACGEDGGTK